MKRNPAGARPDEGSPETGTRVGVPAGKREPSGAAPRAVLFDPALRRLAVVVVLGTIMTVLDTTIMNVAIGTLGRDFDTSLSTIQWVLTGYTLALSVAIPVTGWAVRRFGTKSMWLVSLALFTTGSILCGAAWSLGSLIAFRVLQGLGGGMLAPIGQGMLARAAGPDRMGRVMSVVAVPAMLGPVLGPVLGGLIVDNVAWRWLFFVNVPFCALALIMAIRFLPSDTDRRPDSRVDALGLALLSPGLAVLVFGLSEVGNASGPVGARPFVWICLGFGLVGAFAVHALRRTREPLLDLRLLRHRPFATATGAMFVYCTAMFGGTVLLPLYAQIVRNDTPMQAGLLLAPMGLGAMLGMPVSGRLADRAGPRRPALLGLLVVVIGFLACTQIGAATTRAGLYAVVFVIGIGHGLMMPSLMAAAYQGLLRSSVPEATATMNILIRVGSSLGVAALAVVLQIAIRTGLPEMGGSLEAAAAHRSPATVPLLADAFGRGFWWAFGIAVLAAVPIALFPRRERTATDS